MIRFLRYRPALRFALLYFLVAGLWITFADSVLATYVRDPQLLAQLQMFSGWAFVLATSGLLYLGVKRELMARKQAQEALRQQNEYLDALHETTLALMNRLELNDLLATVVSKAGALTGTEHGYVDLILPGQSKLESWGGTGVFKHYVGFRKKLGEGLGGRVWESGEPLVVDDYDTWPGRVPGFRQGLFHALVGIPLKSGSRMMGVLALAYVEPGRRFDDEQVRLLNGFSELAALALDNARLYTAVQTELAERRRAEAERRAAEVKYRALVEQIPAVTYTLSIQDRGQMLYISPQIERILGFPTSDWLTDPKLWLNQLYPDDRERVLSQMARGPDGGQPSRKLFSSEYRLFTRTAQVVWIHDEAVLVRDEFGEPQFIQGIMRDITEHKQAEAALQASEERVRLLLNSTAEAIYGLDLRGNCTFANAACLRLLGYAHQDDLLGRNMHSLIHHSRLDGTPCPLSDCGLYAVYSGTAGNHSDDDVVWRANGTSFPAEYWTIPVRQGDELVGAVVTLVDITERRRVHQQVRQNAIRTALLAEVSHELFRASFDLGEVLGAVARYVAVFLGDACGIYLISDDAQVVEARAFYHPDTNTRTVMRELLAASPLRTGEGILGEVIQTGRPAMIPDLTQAEVLSRLWQPHAEMVRRFGLHSALMVPLRLQGHVVGALMVARQAESQPYSDDDELLLQELSDRVALAVANARLLALAREALAERQRAEEALRESDAHYRQMLDHAAEGILISDPQGRLLMVSGRACELLGYTRDELLRLDRRDVLVPEAHAARAPDLDRLAAGETMLGHARLRRKDGTYLAVELNARRLDNGSLQTIVRGIAERPPALALTR